MRSNITTRTTSRLAVLVFLLAGCATTGSPRGKGVRGRLRMARASIICKQNCDPVWAAARAWTSESSEMDLEISSTEVLTYAAEGRVQLALHRMIDQERQHLTMGFTCYARRGGNKCRQEVRLQAEKFRRYMRPYLEDSRLRLAVNAPLYRSPEWRD